MVSAAARGASRVLFGDVCKSVLERSCRGESGAVACNCPHSARGRSSPCLCGRSVRPSRSCADAIATGGPWRWPPHRSRAARGWAPGVGFVMHETSGGLVYVQGAELYLGLFFSFLQLHCFWFPSLGEGIQALDLAAGEGIWVQARYSKPRPRRGLCLLMCRWGS